MHTDNKAAAKLVLCGGTVMDKLLIVIYAVLVAATIYSGKNGGFNHEQAGLENTVRIPEYRAYPGTGGVYSKFLAEFQLGKIQPGTTGILERVG